MTELLGIDIPRSLDTIVRDYAKAGTSMEAWVFEDEAARRAAEATLAASGVQARIRSAYKPLLHFFLEEIELSGLSAVTIFMPSHPRDCRTGKPASTCEPPFSRSPNVLRAL